MKLTELQKGQVAQIASMDGNSDFISRLMEMGFSNGLDIRLIKIMPFEGPVQIRIRNFLVSLRFNDADKINVKLT